MLKKYLNFMNITLQTRSDIAKPLLVKTFQIIVCLLQAVRLVPFNPSKNKPVSSQNIRKTLQVEIFQLKKFSSLENFCMKNNILPNQKRKRKVFRRNYKLPKFSHTLSPKNSIN